MFATGSSQSLILRCVCLLGAVSVVTYVATGVQLISGRSYNIY